jgi:hypothetical protein
MQQLMPSLINTAAAVRDSAAEFGGESQEWSKESAREYLSV